MVSVVSAEVKATGKGPNRLIRFTELLSPCPLPPGWSRQKEYGLGALSEAK